MADKNELTIVVEAVNKASAQLKQVEKDLGDLSKQVDSGNVVTKNATGGAESMFGAFVKGGLVVKGIEMAFNMAKDALIAFKDVMNESVDVAATYEASMTGLSSVARSFGYDVDKTLEAAKRLSKDGLLTPAQAAEALKNVLAGLSGATLEQGEAMVLAMKDTASFNRTLYDYGDAIIQTTRGIRNRNSILTDSAGVQKNLSIIMAEQGYEIQDLDSASKKYAATQVLINGYLDESKFAYGDATRYLETYRGKQTELNAVVLDVKRLFGESVMPVFIAFTETLKSAAGGLQTWLGENQGKIQTLAIGIGEAFKNVVESVSAFFERNKDIIKAVVNFVVDIGGEIVSRISVVWNTIQVLAGGIEFAVRSIANAGKILAAAVQGDWKGVSAAYDEWINKSTEIQQGVVGNFKDLQNASKNVLDKTKFDIDKWWSSIAGTQKATRKEILDDAMDSNAKISNEDLKTLQKLAKENEKYQREVEKRAKAFSESFDDLVMKHRDTIKQLTEDLAKEGRNYQKEVVNLLEEYNDSMDEIKKSHADKTKSILDDMEEERIKALEEIEKINEGYTEQKSLIGKEGESRVADLQSQLDKELALGDNANQEKIAALRAMIALEKEGLQTALDDIQAKNDEEVSDVNEKLDKTLAKIQEELDAENQLYAESLADRKAQYDEDLQNAKESYEEKRIELQTQLDTELVIRQKYADDFARIGDKVALDDITRLINKFNDEKAEMERDHLEKLAEIKGTAYEQGKAQGESYNDGLQSTLPTIKSTFDQIKSFSNDVQGNLSKVGDYYSSWNTPSVLGVGSNVAYGATGGLFSKPTVIGEAGAEVVLPLSFPKRMAQIMKSMGMGGGNGGQVNQNFYVTVNNPQDVDVLMERAGFAMKNQGGLT